MWEEVGMRDTVDWKKSMEDMCDAAGSNGIDMGRRKDVLEYCKHSTYKLKCWIG